MTERWRDIEGCPDYQVSDLGRVKSLARIVAGCNGAPRRISERIRKLLVVRVKGKPSSVRVTIRHKSYIVAVLVLRAFKGPRPPGQEGCHNDGHAMNNVLTNLRWDTRESNVDDVYRHGLRRRNWAPSVRTLRGRNFVSGYLAGISGLI